jgi:membrane-bound serine protease (ClpP class)
MTPAAAPFRRARRRTRACILLLAGLFLLTLSGMASAHDGHGSVHILQVRGVIDGPVAGYIQDAVTRANASSHTGAVVVQLDSPGALKTDVSGLLQAVRDSRVPVVVWIPPGGEAAGAGHALAQTAHLLAVSPGSQLGPAQPLDLATGAPSGPSVLVIPDGAAPDEVVARPGAKLLTEAEAVEEGLAAFSAPELPDVLRELDGRVVQVAVLGKQTLRVDPVTADVRFDNMGLGRRVLHAVASPPLAYLLLVAGALALVFEVFQPGFGVSGITGVVLLGLSAYGLTALPVRPLGAALLVLGLLLLSIDLSLAGLGVLTAGGAIGLVAGSLLLFEGPDVLRLSPWLIAFVVASALVFFVIVMTVVLKAQAGQAQEGADKVVGKRAVVRSMLNPEGHVFVDGALWRARAPEGAGRLKTGTVVRVVGLDDRLTLQVELEPENATAE